jgi:HD-like signal output (HDOD) protein
MKALRIREEKKCPLNNAEFETLGTTHSEIGAWLAEKWNLPAEITATIMYHHNPIVVDMEYRSLVLLCHSANYICNQQRIGDGGDLVAPTLYEDTWKKLGLTLYDIIDIIEQSREESSKSEILMALL